MKRAIAFAAVLAALFCELMLVRAAAGSASTHKEEAEGCLRLHVIANSDSDEDQRIKLLVRDALLEEFDGASAASAEEAELRLRQMGERLVSAAERILKEQGADYSVQLESGVFDFPDRTYGEKLYPAGEYRALRVILGAGEGQNWWCVMFPPLCVIDTGSGTEYNDDGTLVFRSFFAELWRSIFG